MNEASFSGENRIRFFIVEDYYLIRMGLISALAAI